MKILFLNENGRGVELSYPLIILMLFNLTAVSSEKLAALKRDQDHVKENPNNSNLATSNPNQPH